MLGLCICYYNNNYGSMLQAYATVREIEKRNIEYEIIGYKKRLTPTLLGKNVFRIFNKTWRSEQKTKIQKNISQRIHPRYKLQAEMRNKMFMDFQKTHFEQQVKVYYGYDELTQNVTKYSSVVVGSDQMWSPSGLATNFYNLMFVPKHINKISYASSFGVSSIPWYQRTRTRKFLNRIDYISVRENEGADIVKELTGRTAMVAVDPTMLLTKEEWDVFSGGEPLHTGKYILAYFLGNNQEHRKYVQELKVQTGYPIVTLKHLDEYICRDEMFGDYAPYDIGPYQFVNLLKHAEYICTDSFHGSVFSIIFGKQFLTFSRYTDTSDVSKNSRIYSLLENLGLQNRLFTKGNILQRMQTRIDYNIVEEKRQNIIRQSKEFLDCALGRE